MKNYKKVSFENLGFALIPIHKQKIMAKYPILVLVISAVLTMACNTQKENDLKFILFQNSSQIQLTDKGVSLDLEKLDYPTGLFPLIKDSNGNVVPAQLDDLDADGMADEIFLVADFPPGEERKFSLEWISQPQEFEKRTAIRFGKREAADFPVKALQSDTLPKNGLPKSIGYQPYQTDGPSWENDKVGFRHYFDGRNSKDLFGKKISAMSPKNVGINSQGAVEDNYHVMEDWGRDILGVGNSVGLGGFALTIAGQPFRMGVTVNDSINYIENSIFRIVSQGPVRSIMDFEYHNWTAGERTYPLVKERVSIIPGMFAFKSEVRIADLKGDETLSVGLVNIHNDKGVNEIIEFNDWIILWSHDMQSYEKEWYLGMALVLPKSAYLGYTEAQKSGDLSNTYLAQLSIASDQPVSYYAIGAWELSDEGFRDAAYFEKYLRDFTSQLEAKVAVVYE